MCGISGIINFQSSSKDDELSIEKMNKRLLSRGPDANSIWSSEDKMTFLGHTRLSIIDPFESSNQPLPDFATRNPPTIRPKRNQALDNTNQ